MGVVVFGGTEVDAVVVGHYADPGASVVCCFFSAGCAVARTRQGQNQDRSAGMRRYVLRLPGTAASLQRIADAAIKTDKSVQPGPL